MDCDAVVVGGGFAGVTAARELASRGLSTILLEARDRLGGRTWLVDFAGRSVELGGTWIHWSQPHVWAEMTRYGLAIEEDVLTFDAGLLGSPPRRYPPDEAFAKVAGVFNRYATAADRSALPRPYDPLYDAAALEIDQLSMEDRLDELGISEADRVWVSGLLYSMAGSPLNESGLMPVLRWMALGGWGDMDRTFGGYRPVGGTPAILQAMLSDGRVDVRLSSPARAVEVSDDGVRVTTRSGETIAARLGVMAAPVNVWPTIEFSPALPPSHRNAGKEGMGKPHYDKVFIHVRGDIGRVFAELPAPEPLNYFLTEKYDGDTQIIVGTNQNPSLDISDKQQVAETIRRHVPEIDEVLDVRGHAWAADEYSRGGNTFHRPGQLRYLADLQKPLGRLAFAGADIATGYFGHIDGAIESGLRAARVLSVR
ncbi:flavin monoamine oxidase family protein [Kribbella speibonae]|uniref:flavin monoamine oxidase family protein n=1 Tax=Kribbella speibonae TaxID=1572660 RepID=UPI0013F4748A|nr:NAD(P)/FAD-dependent oxidoreductase [Kribbella speibonae]